MRKQYYFQNSPRGLMAWDVDRLVRLSSGFRPVRVQLADIRELDEPWHGEEPATWRTMVDHIRLIHDAEMTFPIILSARGTVMDGRHRVAKALLEGRTEIEAVRFVTDPEPDYIGRDPGELPY